MWGFSAFFAAMRDRWHHREAQAAHDDPWSSAPVVRTEWTGHADVASDIRIDRMMRAFHIDRHELEEDYPGVLRDVQATCLGCRSKRRCFRELENGTAVANAEHFCPNADVLMVFANDPDEAALRRGSAQSSRAAWTACDNPTPGALASGRQVV